MDSCLDDVDDEVRDRAAFYLDVLESTDLSATYVENRIIYSILFYRIFLCMGYFGA